MEKTPLVIELPESLQRYAEERVRDGAYPDVNALLLDLLRRDRDVQAAQQLRERVQEGLQSGPARELTDLDWSELRQRVRAGDS
jgi:putative addiction module CopG family antidote